MSSGDAEQAATTDVVSAALEVVGVGAVALLEPRCGCWAPLLVVRASGHGADPTLVDRVRAATARSIPPGGRRVDVLIVPGLPHPLGGELLTPGPAGPPDPTPFAAGPAPESVAARYVDEVAALFRLHLMTSHRS